MTVNINPQDRSFLHRLDPRTKLLVLMLFTTLVFFIDSLLLSAAQMVFFLLLALCAQISFAKIFPHRKFLLFLIIVVIVLQMIFGSESSESRYVLNPLFPGWIPLLGGKASLKLDGLLTGLMIGCRIISLTVLLPLLTMTTDARILACGINKLGIHYRMAFIITSTLNLIPFFEEETRLILESRKLRGMDALGRGSFFSRLKEYPAVALPLMIRAMRKAQLAGLAMDSRAFGAYKTRTWLLTLKMSALDYGGFAIGISYAAIILAAQYLCKG